MDPFTQSCSFQTLLNSQNPNSHNPYPSDPLEPTTQPSASVGSVFGSQWTEDGNGDTEAVSDRKERRNKWSPTEDGVLISAWLNTSKDAVVSNEQKAVAFWKRIAAYYAASPKVAGMQKREPNHCKSRWGKINERVCKFVGSYEAAKKQRSSGQNDDVVLKMAHQAYYNDYKTRFTMEHAWLELRHDQKWCGASTTTNKVQSKRKKLNDHSTQSADHGEDEARPIGVKAKAQAKKSVTKPATSEEDMAELQSIWEMRQKDYAERKELNKQKLLEGLITTTEPLTELEKEMKTKLITEMLGL